MSDSRLVLLDEVIVPQRSKSILVGNHLRQVLVGFPEFYKELEAEILGEGAQLMGLQFIQLDLRLGKSPSRSFRPVKSILEKEKLSGSNFLDWYRNLRIILRNEQKLHHLEEALPEAPTATATAAVRNAYTRRVAEQQEVACLMLQAEQELFETVKAFHACKQEEGQSVSTYVLKMKAYLDQMEHLGYPMPLTIPELHAMLKLAEKGIPKKTHVVLAIRQDWTLEEELSSIFGRVKEEQSQCIWRIRGYQKLNKGALDLYVGNGHSAAVEAIGSFELILPSGMILVLDNCHFSPSITRGIVSLSRLWDKGFRHEFMDNGAILVSKDNICYFNAFPRDGIFEIDMHNHISNERSIYTCSNKKTKHNLDSTFRWHYRLGHINKNRIEKLQHDGLLESIDDESFDVCVSCISGKMARKPFTHASERADDLLGIIHSDVCGPFRTTSREGANYYVTFTDDFSRYGYVYLIKHKHEVFEMFKTFQNEVENQLGKTIKALRSNRRGEYLTQEFLDHLRSGGIITYLLSYSHKPTMCLKIYLGLDLHWGCEAFVKRDTPNKLESRSIKCIFVGYPKETIGYYFYYPLENKFFVARYAEFFETNLIKQEASGSTIEFDEIQSENAQPSENTSLHQHETVGSKWLFKKKTDMDGNIHTYKACLVVKGFTQTYEVDYEETFSPVADIKAIRILIAITTYYDYEIWQMDVKTAFLNGRLNEDVYMVQPERMDTSKCGTIPMQPNVDLSNTQGPSTPAEVKRMKGIPYASAVGSIMYAVRNTKDKFLVYGGDSTTELGAVDWKSSKQSTTTTSFMEAEYIVAAETAMEAIWIRAITIVNEPSVQRGAKHFRRKYHFIREAIQEGDIRILKVHTDDNLADPFTKPMPCTKHVEHARSIGLRPAGSFM
ncbi:retrotransposon protein, putative, ty1-copia subclass [Tanacetum coccineum]